MQTRGIFLSFTMLGAAAALALSGCTSSPDEEPKAATKPTARSVDFGEPTTPQDAEKAVPPGDRTTQILWDVATNGKRLVAVGRDESFNIIQPLILSSDDAGATWVRRQLTADSLEQSSVEELPGLVASGPGGFVAVGPSSAGPVVWTSADGTDWTRQPSDRKTFQGGDTVVALTVGAQGYVLIGESEAGSGGSSNQAVVWRSPDGIKWQRAAGPGIGMTPQVPGVVSISDVAAHGKTVVVSGTLSTSGDPKQSERLQYWHSADGGATFARAAVTGDVASSFRTFTRTVSFHQGRFYSLIMGSGPNPDRDTGYDGVVLEGGAAGTSWRVAARPSALANGDDEVAQALHRVGKNWVVVNQITAENTQTTVVAGPNWNEMAEYNDPGQVGPGDQAPHGSVVIGSDVVIVGSNDVSGTTEAAIWRYQPAQSKTVPVTLPVEASGGRPSAQVKKVVQAGQDLVAIGDIADAPMSWTHAGTWSATALPGRTAEVTPGIVDAAVAPDGRVAGVGYTLKTPGRDAALWLRAANGKWSAVTSPAFGRLGTSEYGGPLPHSIAIGPKGWVIAGERFDGDGHTDAWVAHSTDGKTWQNARGDQAAPVDKDTTSPRSPWRNFRAPAAENDAVMNTVTADGKGFVAGGYLTAGPATTATVWLSPDGLTWPTRVNLPAPKGFSAAEVSSVGRVGNTLTAVGPVSKTKGDPEAGWMSWYSADNGKTWRAGAAPALAQATVKSIVTVTGGLVALGTTGPRESTDAAAWFSADGVKWRPVELPGDRVKGPGVQALVSAVVQGDKLLVVASDTPPSGGGFYTLELPVPS